MKSKFAVLLGVAMLFATSQNGFSADTTNELHALIEQISTDLKSGKQTEAALADDIKQFDVLLAKQDGKKLTRRRRFSS